MDGARFIGSACASRVVWQEGGRAGDVVDMAEEERSGDLRVMSSFHIRAAATGSETSSEMGIGLFRSARLLVVSSGRTPMQGA